MPETVNPWILKTISGLAAMGRSQHTEAARLWLSARDLVSDLPPGDATRLVGEANAGAALLLVRSGREAERMLAAAEQGWIDLYDEIRTWDVPMPGRSSAFHSRLAARNVDAFQNAERERIAKWCEACLAITRWNLRCASGEAPNSSSSAAILVALFSDVFGPRSPEVRLLEAAALHRLGPAADKPYADKAAELAALRAADLESSDAPWRRLVITANLLVLLRPGLGNEAAMRMAIESGTH
jgi:hypothetical protein